MTDANNYQCLFGKLTYLLVTRPNITYVVIVLSHFMSKNCTVHCKGALQVLAYIKRAPGKWLIYRHHDHLCIEAYSYARHTGDKGY